MKNKVELKKYLKFTIFISIFLLTLFLVINIFEYQSYVVNFNNKINQIVSVLLEKYPMLTETEIIEILNSEDVSSSHIFDKYGINIKEDSIIEENNKSFLIFLGLNTIFEILLIVILIFIFLKYNKKKDKDIRDITNYIEEINRKNYSLSIDSISEDELSILKNEIYKTTIMLKE